MLLYLDGQKDIRRQVGGLLLGFFPFLLTGLIHVKIIEPTEEALFIIFFAFFIFVFLGFIYEMFSNVPHPFANLAFIVLSMVYIGIPFTLLQFIAFDGDRYYPNIVFGLLVLNWFNDTGAFTLGSKKGKTPLFPRISPKKTWEGTISGSIISLFIGALISLIFVELRLIDWLVLSLMVSIFGTIGDLVESMLKRSLNLKDSGNMLPGHGGFLDRFDAFIFILPFAAAYILIIRGF